MVKPVRRLGPLVAFGMVVAGMIGCESLGISPPNNPLLKDAKTIRDAAPVPAPGGRELAKELLPTHIVEPGDTLLVQPTELDSPVRLPPDQLVQQDGTVDLGVYGRPVVAGRTVPQIESQIKAVIAAHDKKETAVTVRLISKPGTVFYVLGEVNAPGAFPLAGRETVLDGIIAAGGVTRRASLGNIVLARPTPSDSCRVVLPVCYRQIVQLGDTTTNHQLQPGDRIFVPSKTTMENLCPQRFATTAAACCRPQVPCAGGVCAPVAGPGSGTVMIPPVPGSPVQGAPIPGSPIPGSPVPPAPLPGTPVPGALGSVPPTSLPANSPLFGAN